MIDASALACFPNLQRLEGVKIDTSGAESLPFILGAVRQIISSAKVWALHCHLAVKSGPSELTQHSPPGSLPGVLNIGAL